MNNSEEKKFSNEIALVTGGTQGLGKSIAKMFVQRGIKSIIISGRNENNAKYVIKELESLGAKAFFIKAELSDLQQCSNLIQEIDKKFGKIDILVNSAASTERGTILSTSPELFNKMINTNVRAPFSGTIGLRSISKGTYVTPTTVVAKLVNTDKLKITFSVPEKYASQIQVGTKMSFTTSDSKENHNATIYAIDPEVDIATRTLRVRAITDNQNHKLYPGAYTNVNLPLETAEDAILVPTESLIPVQNGKRIYIVENGKAKEIDVEIGSRTGSSVRVISGLRPGDTIITYGVMALQNGMPIKVNLE